jgi:transcriptional regulator with XRE-family HTH domain
MRRFDFTKIKRFRLRAKLTQDELAVLLTTEKERVWTQQISAWERGKVNIKAEILGKLSTVLGRNMEDFFVDEKVSNVNK